MGQYIKLRLRLLLLQHHYNEGSILCAAQDAAFKTTTTATPCTPQSHTALSTNKRHTSLSTRQMMLLSARRCVCARSCMHTSLGSPAPTTADPAA